MSNFVEKLYSLIRFSICGKALPADFTCSEEEKRALVKAAQSHEITPIVVYALDKNGFLTDADEEIKDEELFATGRVTALDFFAEEVYDALDKNGFDYMPLKGSLVRKYYPEQHFRTSTDVDVLVRKSDFLAAEKLIKEKLRLKEKQRTEHDVALSRSMIETVELHHSLVEGGRANAADGVLENVWDNAASDGRRYAMTDAFFLFYIVAHTLKHFAAGGCGLRFFIDLYLIDKSLKKPDGVEELFDRGRVKRFYEASLSFSEYLMSGENKTEAISELEEFVLKSGVFGSVDNKAVVSTKKKGKGLKYVFKRVFLPYEELVGIFPKLEGRRALKPFYQVKRWFTLFRGGRLKRNLRQAKSLSKVDEEKTERLEKLFAYMGVEE